MKILLIAGGWSTEREVSLNGAHAMQQALVERGHSVTFFDRLWALTACLKPLRRTTLRSLTCTARPAAAAVWCAGHA